MDASIARAVVMVWLACSCSCSREPRGAGAGSAALAAAPVERAEPAPAEAPLLIAAPGELVALERLGLGFADQLSLPRYASLAVILESDLAVLRQRDGIARSQFPLDLARLNYVFDPAWLRAPNAHFELVGVVNRLDMQFSTPGECGQIRMIYRLAIQATGRPVVRLPMTISVIRPLPIITGSCQRAAQQWRSLPGAPAGRPAALARLIEALPAVAHVETNLQDLHGPGTPAADDHAEYLLRSFDVAGDRVVPRPLLNTPRGDLGPAERRALAAWITAHFAEIDAGRAVIPDRFLATRAVSLSPRGLARPGNRVFAQLFGADPRAFAELPYATATRARSPRGLLRRLDGMTCTGCHQSRALAGFHLPGEERDPERTFNALAVGVSPHLHDELAWRARRLTAIADGAPFDEPRPFPEHAIADGATSAGAAPAGGNYGAHCGLGDPSFADWTCADGLTCHDTHHDEVGACAPPTPGAGDACEDARVQPRAGADGDQSLADPPERCRGELRPAARCIANAYGFPLGFCSEPCKQIGARWDSAVCAPMLLSGYEQLCFPTDQPIEACVRAQGLLATITSRACSADAPCRDDYGCLRYPGSAPGTGACVPPYFLFDFRVDGPRSDR